MGEGNKKLSFSPSPIGRGGWGVRATSTFFGNFSIAIYYSYLSQSL
jgi:hypothetical protein